MGDEQKNGSNPPPTGDLPENHSRPLLVARIDQFKDATRRTRMALGLLTILSFILLTAILLQHCGWTTRRISEIDTELSLAISGEQCPCLSQRIRRYNENLYREGVRNFHTFLTENTNPTPEEFEREFRGFCLDYSALDSKIVPLTESIRNCNHSEKMSEHCRHTEHAKLCYEALKTEHSVLMRKWIDQQRISLPLLGVEISSSDGGIIIAIAMLLLLSYLYASIRRENHVLYEFVRVCSQNEKHIMISDMIQTVLADMKLCKRPTYHVTFEEPCFNKHYYYEAYESLAHYFVLLSSGPDRLLKSIAFTFMFLPILSLGINLGFDMYDAFTWYGTISDTLKPRLIAELVLFITVLFLSINSWVITGKIITSLQVWNIINNTYIAPACRKEGLYEVEMEKLIVEQKRYAIQLNSDNELVCFIPVE